MADALGTPNGVVSALDHRLAQGGMLALTGIGMDVRTGVLAGPGTTALVTGTSATGTMTVAVAAHHWVGTRATADGVYLGSVEAATTVTIAAAPGSNSRIDVIYVKQNDSTSSVTPDASMTMVVDKVTGTAAVSPTKPALPVGAVEIATVTVAAGATATNGAGVTITNTARQTVARGARIPVRSQTERDALTTYAGLEVYRLDTGNIEARDAANTGWVTVYDAAGAGAWTTFTPGWTATSTAPSIGNGSIVGRYRQVGKTVHLSIEITLGSTTNGGTGAWQFSGLPVAARGSQQVILCKAFTSGNLNWTGFGLLNGSLITPYLPASSTTVSMQPAQGAAAGGASGTGIPLIPGNFTFVSGCNMAIQGTYEAA